MTSIEYEPITLPTNHGQDHNHLTSFPQRTVKSKKEKRTSTIYKYILRRSCYENVEAKSGKEVSFFFFLKKKRSFA